MTRVISEGFEMGDLVGIVTNGGAADSGRGRSGTYAGGMSTSESFTFTLSNLDEFYVRVPFYVYGTSTNRRFRLYWMKDSTVLGCILVDFPTSPFVNIQVGSTTVAIGTTRLFDVNGQYYSLEVHIKISDTGDIETKIDGNVEVSYSGDTKPGADTYANKIYILNNSSHDLGSSSFMFIDDIAVNDTAGGVDDSWCGDGHIILLKPNGDTATLDLTPSAAVGHYTLVDDIPKDGDTTYVEGSVVDEEDIYDLQACGLGEVIINRIWTEARAKDTASTGQNIALITKASGGAEVSGGDVPLLSSYSKKILGAEELVNPVDSNPWEVADIDALQGGVRTRS